MYALLNDIDAVPARQFFGRVKSIQELLVQIAGPVQAMRVGSGVRIVGGLHGNIPCEVAGFCSDFALTMPFGHLDGVRMGAKASVQTSDYRSRTSTVPLFGNRAAYK